MFDIEISDEINQKIKSFIEKGQYSLLTGAGVSLDSKNSSNEYLLSGPELVNYLMKSKNLDDNYTLQECYNFLDFEEKNQLIRSKFINCIPGMSVKRITNYLWRKIFTFNIDDALEEAYKQNDKMQSHYTILYDEVYEENQNSQKIPIIHLHGYVHRDSEFIFSHESYITITENHNRWFFYLGDTLTTESFIIIGSSFKENDLKYFINNKTVNSQQASTAPSILIEPFPNELTKYHCKKHGLLLFKGTCVDFFNYIDSLKPFIQSSTEILKKRVGANYNQKLKASEILSFSRNFTDIKYELDQAPQYSKTDFYKGSCPIFNDIRLNLDIGRDVVFKIKSKIKGIFDGNSDIQFIVILAELSSGKSTICKRVAFDLNNEGCEVLIAKKSDLTDLESTANVINSIEDNLIILVDDFLDNAYPIFTISKKLTKKNIVFLVAERNYRESYVLSSLQSSKYELVENLKLTEQESVNLINLYIENKQINNSEVLQNRSNFIRSIIKKPIYEACYRITHDGSFIENAVQSVLNDKKWKISNPSLYRYLVCAIIEKYYRAGVSYKLLTKIAGFEDFENQIELEHPLRLICHGGDIYDYVNTQNSFFSQIFLGYMIEKQPNDVFQTLVKVASALAFYVNRKNIKIRTSEVKISQELFLYKSLRPLIKNRCEEFYDKIEPNWQWNSRFWEQRALLSLELTRQKSSKEKYFELALKYAKFAVSLERHPFTLTTLAKVELSIFFQFDKNNHDFFNSAFEHLAEAHKGEMSRFIYNSRRPFVTLADGIIKYYSSGHQLNPYQVQLLHSMVLDLGLDANRDKELSSLVNRISKLDIIDDLIHNLQ